jgi:hypothetical protein
MSYVYRDRERATRGGQTELAEAEDLFERFHCFRSAKTERTACDRRIPQVLVRLGRLRAVIYESDRGQCGRPRSFVHRFAHPAALLADPRGRRLFVFGGKLRVSKLGLEG